MQETSRDVLQAKQLQRLDVHVMQSIPGGMWAQGTRSARQQQLQESMVAQRMALQILLIWPA